MSGAAFGQVDIAKQSFEGLGSDNWSYTPNPVAGSFTSSGDEWDVLTSLGSLSSVPTDGTNFFGGVDINNGDNPNGSFGILTFGSVSVAGFTSVSIQFDYEVDGFDTGDDIDYVVSIDGVPQTSVKLVDGVSNFNANGTETINIPDGSSNVSIEVTITQNGTDYVGVDNFKVTGISGSATPEANFAVTSASEVEGNTGITTHQVTVNMVPAATGNVDLTLSVDGASTATNTTDFTVPTTVSFVNGESSKTFDITINGDTDIESDETVILNLGLSSGTANIGSSNQYTLTITNNDFPACTEPAAQPTSLILTPSAASVSGSFTAATADGYLVVQSTSSTLSATPMDATTYTAGDALGGGTVVSAASNTSFSATGLSQGTQYYFFVFAYNDQNCTDINYLTMNPLNGDATTTTLPNVVINEIDCDQANDEDEFIELYGTPNLSLDGLVLVFVNGNDDLTYESFDLDGHTLDANGFFTIGNVTGAGITFSSSNNVLQNGADAVALYLGDATDFPNDTDPTTTNLIDAIAYDTNDGDDATLLGKLGLSVQYNEDENGDKDNHSIQRFPDGTNNFVITTATPANVNLPVELLHFTAKANNNAAILTWATASEENNAYFDVQRSTDGINFETIGQVEGAGTTYDVQEYTFIDESPVNGINYYRLRQVDIDGQFEFHKIEVVTINGLKNGVVIVPTQVCNQFDVVFGETIDATVEMNIVSVNGQTVKSEVININGNHQTINVSELNVGVYLIRMNVNNTIVTKRFVKL